MRNKKVEKNHLDGWLTGKKNRAILDPVSFSFLFPLATASIFGYLLSQLLLDKMTLTTNALFVSF